MEKIINHRERLLKVIQLTGLKQGAFAHAIGVSAATISHITSVDGRKSPITDDLAEKIRSAFPHLHLSRQWLVNGEEANNVNHMGNLFDSVSNPTDQSVNEPYIVSSLNMDDLHQFPAEKISKAAPKNISKAVAKDGDDEDNTIANSSISKSKNDENLPLLERVVLFYSDGSFIDYRPGRK